MSFSQGEAQKVFQIVEIEIMSLHEENIVRFKIRPSEFFEWKKLQGPKRDI